MNCTMMHESTNIEKELLVKNQILFLNLVSFKISNMYPICFSHPSIISHQYYSSTARGWTWDVRDNRKYETEYISALDA
jgi:hypothetical protein